MKELLVDKAISQSCCLQEGIDKYSSGLFLLILFALSLKSYAIGEVYIVRMLAQDETHDSKKHKPIKTRIFDRT